MGHRDIIIADRVASALTASPSQTAGSDYARWTPSKLHASKPSEGDGNRVEQSSEDSAAEHSAAIMDHGTQQQQHAALDDTYDGGGSSTSDGVDTDCDPNAGATEKPMRQLQLQVSDTSTAASAN